MNKLLVRLAALASLGVSATAGATHFMVGADSDGNTRIFVMSGVVAADRNNSGSNAGSGPGGTSFVVHPSQQAYFFEPDPETEAAALAYGLLDLEELLGNVTPDVIAALLQNKAEMDQENQEFLGQLQRSLEGNQPGVPKEPGPGNEDEQARQQANLDQLIATLVANALNNTHLTEDEVAALVAQSNAASGRQPDLEGPPMDDSQEQARRQQQEALARQRQQQVEQQRQREQQARNNQDVLDRMQQQREAQQKHNEQAAADARERAEQALRDKMSEEERERFRRRQEQQAREQKKEQQERARQQAERRNRLLAGGPSPDLDPSTPATPDSHQNHIAATSPGVGTNDPNPPVPPNQALDDVQSDFANQRERQEDVEQVADEVAGLTWDSFVAYNADFRTLEPPVESIYGAPTATYSGLVQGTIGNAPEVTGTLDLRISFADWSVGGELSFDNDPGALEITGNLDETVFSANMWGEVFGGTAEGNLNGFLYGQNAEEAGGTWELYLSGGDYADEFASGRFAAKQ